MAKIENYSNDTDITNNDRLFGTSVNGNDSETANFKVGELKTFINTGYATTSEVATAKAEAIAAAAANTDGDVSAATASITTAYQTYADQAEADANTYTDSKAATNLALIQSNDTGIATNTTNISSLSTDINTNSTDISTNASAISTNTSAISTNTSAISTNSTNISAITPAYQAYTQAAIEQKFAFRVKSIQIDGTTNLINTAVPIDIQAFGTDPNNNSLKYDTDTNDSLGVTYTTDKGDYIENESLTIIPVKISFSMFTTTGSSSTNLKYRLEKSSDSGSTWTEEELITRPKSSSSFTNVDSFFLYYGIATGDYIRFSFEANHTGTVLQAGSWIEVVAINPQT